MRIPLWGPRPLPSLTVEEMDENSFDVIIFGTGLVESIVAACVLYWLYN